MLAEVLTQILGQIEQHGARDRRIDGPDELELVKEFAIVVAGKDDSILSGEEVLGKLLTAEVLSLHVSEVDADWKRGDDIGETLDPERSLVFEIIELDMPTERLHLVSNVSTDSLDLRRAGNTLHGDRFD